MSDSMIPQIPKTAAEGIVKYLGNETAAFLQKAEVRLEKYTKLWQLSRLNFMQTDTVNILFECESANHGPCVLKLCIPGPEVATEINCIRAYSGNGYVKLWEYSLEDDILLLERITPGLQMWEVTDHKQRARLMAQRINDLRFIHCEQSEYPSYRTWLMGIHEDFANKSGVDGVKFYLNEAIRIYNELRQTYQRNCLLHGDMHQENMLLNSQGGYTIIDPKGVVDDPVMETARFLMNENEAPYNANKILEIVSILSPVIGIPKADILKSMYIDAAMGQCWTLDEHFPSQEAFKIAKTGALETCAFVYGILEVNK